jgi:hypothetical protein
MIPDNLQRKSLKTGHCLNPEEKSTSVFVYNNISLLTAFQGNLYKYQTCNEHAERERDVSKICSISIRCDYA